MLVGGKRGIHQITPAFYVSNFYNKLVKCAVNTLTLPPTFSSLSVIICMA